MKSVVVACLLAAGVVAFGCVYRIGVASGADPYGYLSEADLWRSGDLHISQPFMRELPWPEAGETASPLGYRPAAGAELDALVPVYSPGLPMIFAVAKSIGGQPAAFAVVPLFAGLLVLATFGIGSRIGGRAVGLGAAVLIASSPVVLTMALWPMTDCVVAAMWASATWAVLGESRKRAFAGGLLAAMAILIRPNLVGIGVLMGAWVLLRDTRREGEPWWRVDRAAIFAAGTLPGIIAVMAINRALYGSPFLSGYGSLGSVLHLSNLWPNVTRYASWLSLSESPFMALGLVPLALPLTPIWRSRARAFDALLLSLIAVGTLSCYLFFMPMEEWSYLRFLMPMWPGLFIGISWLLFANGGRLRMTIATLLIVALGDYGIAFARDKKIETTRVGERRFITAAELTRAHTEPNSAVFTYAHSGTLRYYGERMTLRYDKLAPEWLDPGVAWLSQHGAHPYLLVDDWELKMWKDRFGAVSPLGRMQMKVVFELEWPIHIWLFDLTQPATTTWPKVGSFREPELRRSVPPAAAPTLTFRPTPGGAR
jgi:hypothetical protein